MEDGGGYLRHINMQHELDEMGAVWEAVWCCAVLNDELFCGPDGRKADVWWVLSLQDG